MGKFKFENQGTNTYLVCRLTGQQIDTMSLGMLTNNKIPGFAPAFYTQQDTELLIKYNVSSHITLRKYFSGIVSKKRLLDIFSNIVTALRSAEEYMLDLNAVLLNLDYIFADTAACKAALICVPILDMPMREYDFDVFFKKIMFSTQFDQTEDCGYVTQMINYLNGTPAFSIDEFGKFIKELEQKPVPVPSHREETTLLNEPQFSVTAKERSLVSEGTVVLQDTPAAPVASKQEEEKEMSLFYLMQHYNKENAAKYKAQKASQKHTEKEEKQKKKQEKKQEKKSQKPEKKNKTRKKTPSVTMAVPNMAQSDTMAAPEKSQREIKAEPENAKIKMPQIPELPKLGTVPAAEHSRKGMLSGGGNFGETTVLSLQDIGETTVLTSAPQPSTIRPYLLRQKNGERIVINRPVFRIGKDKTAVDYPVLDNSAVSRSHADFMIKDSICYVMDKNSTNHTFINGRMIPDSVEVALQDGDSVCLANEVFQFKMM